MKQKLKKNTNVTETLGHHTLRPLSDLVSIMVRTVSYRMAFPTFLLVSVFVATCQGTKKKPRT